MSVGCVTRLQKLYGTHGTTVSNSTGWIQSVRSGTVQGCPRTRCPMVLLCLHCFCRSIEQVQANIECNAVSAVSITHHFLKRMVRASRQAGRQHTQHGEQQHAVKHSGLFQPCLSCAGQA